MTLLNDDEMKVISGFGSGLATGLAALLATNSFLAMVFAHFAGVILFFVLLEVFE